MPSALATMIGLATLLASMALDAPARAACAQARVGPSVSKLPKRWRAVVDELIRLTAEPGHPWSCSGGIVELELIAQGAVLRVAREGEAPVSRQVAVAEDVLPLGQALLAKPLSSSLDSGEPAKPAPTARQETTKPAPTSHHEEITSEPTSERVPSSSTHPMRLVLGGGVDARFVGGSNVGWIGPTLNAAVMMGRWLPSISLRQQSSVFVHRGSIDEISIAIAVQSQFDISPLQLRAGLSIRGASVQRDLPDRRGEQGRLEGRLGVLSSIAFPVFRWASVVVSADADVVGVSRETLAPASTDNEAPRDFPTYTIGGSACLEVPL